MEDSTYKWDVFLAHASEDKAEFVRPLAKALKENGIQVWYDEFEINLGDSIQESINTGLTKSKFAIVVLSKNFFKKSWPNNELNAYFSFESKKAKRILPIWHNVSIADIKKYSPLLADRAAANGNIGITEIVAKVKNRLKIDFTENPKQKVFLKDIFTSAISWDSLTNYTTLKYGLLGIDEYWQASILDNLQDNEEINTIGDIDQIIERVHIALAAYIRERPTAFNTGTDFITKSLGFGNKKFRMAHNFGHKTRVAFAKYQSLIKKE